MQNVSPHMLSFLNVFLCVQDRLSRSKAVQFKLKLPLASLSLISICISNSKPVGLNWKNDVIDEFGRHVLCKYDFLKYWEEFKMILQRRSIIFQDTEKIGAKEILSIGTVSALHRQTIRHTGDFLTDSPIQCNDFKTTGWRMVTVF